MMTEELDMLKYRIKRLLKDNVVEVRFIKKNGEYRDMKCTLKHDVIPPEQSPWSPENKSKYKRASENILPVWDVEKNGWRSFRIANVYDFFVLRPE